MSQGVTEEHQLLDPYIVSEPNEDGECKGFCPLHDDEEPSASFNFEKGVWYCFASCDGGRISTLVQRLVRWEEEDFIPKHAADLVENGQGPQQPPAKAPSGETKLPSEAQLSAWTKRLLHDETKIDRLLRHRGLTKDTILRWEIGWSPEKKAYTIPIHDSAGNLVNVRFKRLGDKVWSIGGHGSGRLYPAEVLDDSSADFILLTAGELDAILAIQEGFAAVTNTVGEKSRLKDDMLEVFRDRDVAIIYDCDETGRKGARKVARQLAGIARSVKVVDLDLPGKGEDLTDYFVKYEHTADDLRRLIARTPVQQEEEDSAEVIEDDADPYRTTDLGNAERLLARHGHEVRYCYEWKTWLVWDGQRWSRSPAEIEARAQDTVRHIWDVLSEIDDADRRGALAKHAHSSESAVKAQNMLKQAQNRAAVKPEEFDQDPFLLNVLNGTLDLRTGKLRSHRQEDMITKLAPVVSDQDAECPLWTAHLKRVLPDEDDRRYLQDWAGYSLTGDVSEEKMLTLVGKGQNGKGTITRTLQEMLGDYAAEASASLLLQRKFDSRIPADVANLEGKRFIVAGETKGGAELDEAAVKRLHGGDRIPAERKYENPYDFAPTHKTWLATNHKPKIRGTDEGIWRRIRLFRFRVQIPESERDPKLKEKLRREFPGILRWAVEGCLRWQRQGLIDSENVRRETAKYRKSEDLLQQFLDRHCVTDPANRSLWISSDDLYQTYRGWAELEGLTPWRSQH